MCISQYGYEPKLLIRETEERLKGVRFRQGLAQERGHLPCQAWVAAWMQKLLR